MIQSRSYLARNKAVGLDCLPDNLYSCEEFRRILREAINSESF